MTPSGIVLLDKKPGITSMASDNFIKKMTGTKKVGHSGTLDPFATGLLPVFVGDALKVMRYTDDYDKAYRCEACFGRSTDTQDKDGEVTGGRMPSEDEISKMREDDFRVIRDAFSSLEKITEQIPPKFSAKKIGGRKAYELARAGEEVGLKPHKVRIYKIEIIDINVKEDGIYVLFDTECSKGTYIRSLCDDAGRITGFGAHAVSLRRTGCGPFSVEDAFTEDEISKMAGEGDFSFLRGRTEALSMMERMELSSSEASDVRLGRKINAHEDALEGVLYAAFHEGELTAVLKRDGDIMRIDRMLKTDA